MAGVYIKGMEMPRNCQKCPFWKIEQCRYFDLNVEPDCPLVEVPDHGDLVDRDASPQLVAVLYTDVSGTVVNPTYKIDLSSLPVVIPADKEEVR